jgi:hypothetical protein
MRHIDALRAGHEQKVEQIQRQAELGKRAIKEIQLEQLHDERQALIQKGNETDTSSSLPHIPSAVKSPRKTSAVNFGHDERQERSRRISIVAASPNSSLIRKISNVAPGNGDKPQALKRNYTQKILGRKNTSTKAANKLVNAIREPTHPVIYFHAVKLHTTGGWLRRRWGFSTEPASSAEMNTSVQEEGSDPMQKLVTFGSVRLSLGIPDDNKQYHIRFIYPTDESREAGFEGGFVYYSGPWNGLTNETKVVGANMMDATGETGKRDNNSFAMQLTKYDAGKPSVYGDSTGSMDDYMVEVGIELQQFQSSTLSGIAVEQWAWLAPTQARSIAKNVEDGVRVTDGAFIFQLPSRTKKGPPVYYLYSMTMRRLVKDPPHQYSKESRMDCEHVQKIASAYTAEYSPPPPTNETPLRFLLLLGGSGAGKSTLLSYLEARGMDRQNYVYSGLDEMLVLTNSVLTPLYSHYCTHTTVLTPLYSRHCTHTTVLTLL